METQSDASLETVHVRKPERYWEIDALRGIAILGMLFFHTLAILVIFHIIIETPTFLAYYNTYVIGTAAFVIIAGVAMILRHERMHGSTDKAYYVALVSKAGILIAIACCITILTWIGANVFLHENMFIGFGFLHMLGLSMLIAIPFLRFKKWNLIFALIIIWIGNFVIPYINGPDWLFVIGFASPEFLSMSIEYFPIFPWLGALLLGIGLGNVFYPNGVRGFKMKEVGKIGKFFSKLGNGRVTLFIYLIHVPVIFIALWIFSAITGIGYI